MSNSNRTLTINLKQPLKTLRGTDMKDNDEVATLGKVIANALVNNTNVDDPIRAFRLASDLFEGEKEYSLKESDLDYILAQWEKFPFTPLLKGQVQLILQDLKLSIKQSNK